MPGIESDLPRAGQDAGVDNGADDLKPSAIDLLNEDRTKDEKDRPRRPPTDSSLPNLTIDTNPSPVTFEPGTSFVADRDSIDDLVVIPRGATVSTVEIDGRHVTTVNQPNGQQDTYVKDGDGFRNWESSIYPQPRNSYVRIEGVPYKFRNITSMRTENGNTYLTDSEGTWTIPRGAVTILDATHSSGRNGFQR